MRSKMALQTVGGLVRLLTVAALVVPMATTVETTNTVPSIRNEKLKSYIDSTQKGLSLFSSNISEWITTWTTKNLASQIAMCSSNGSIETADINVTTLNLSAEAGTTMTTGQDSNCSGPDVDPSSQGSKLELSMKVCLALLMVLMVIVSMLGNSIVCLIVYQKPAMRSAINLLLANMALSNILLSIGCMPFALTTLILNAWVFGTTLCRIIAFLHSFFVCEAVTILMAISVDRYFIIVRHKDKLTPHRARVLILVTWCISVLLSVPPILGWGVYRYYRGWVQCVLGESNSPAETSYLLVSMTLTFYGPMLVMAHAYVCILNTVRKNKHRVHVQNHLNTYTVNPTVQLGLPRRSMAQPPHVSIDMSFKTRAFKTILLLFVVYVLCWAPYAITMVAWNLSHTLNRQALLGNLILWLGYLNTAVNPCIYCWRIKKFREACQEIISKSFKILPNIPVQTKRRINPSAVYEYTDHSTV